MSAASAVVRHPCMAAAAAPVMWFVRLLQQGDDPMKKFCAIYLGTPGGLEKWKKLDEATRKQREQQGMKAWQDWVDKNKAAIVDNGAPLGKTKRIDAKGITDTSNAM